MAIGEQGHDREFEMATTGTYRYRIPSSLNGWFEHKGCVSFGRLL